VKFFPLFARAVDSAGHFFPNSRIRLDLDYSFISVAVNQIVVLLDLFPLPMPMDRRFLVPGCLGLLTTASDWPHKY